MKDNTRKLHTTDEFTCYFKERVIKTQLRLVRTELFERMPAAWREWGDVIRHCDNALDGDKVDTLGRDNEGETGLSSLSRGLEECFEKMELGGNGHRGYQHGSNQNCKHGEHEGTPMHRSAWQQRDRSRPEVSSNAAELYRCTWCKNPSSSDLRKCSRCKMTR